MDKTQKIQQLIGELTTSTDSEEHEKTRQVLKVLLTELIRSFKQFELELPQALIEISQSIQKGMPMEQKVRVVNPEDLKPPKTNFPEVVRIDNKDIAEITLQLKAIKEGFKSLKQQEIKLPKDAKDAIAVRLSDGEKFIEQLTQVITQAVGGGSGAPTVQTTVSGIRGVPVVNPDGSNISIDVGSISGTAAYADASNVEKKGLVDADRHVQVDVLTMPSVSVDTTGLATSTNQTTMIGHLDGVEGLLTTIDADTGNLTTIKTNTDFGTVVGGGTETGALRVTIANNSTGVVSVDDNGGSLTVDGSVSISGTVAVTQSGTWDEVGINDSGNSITVDDGGTSLTVDGTVAVTNSDLTSIKTAVELIDNAISGSEMQVDIVAALPAGTNLLGRVSSSDETSTIYNGTTALTPKFAIIDAATSGNNTLVAAVVSKKIRVHALFLVSAGTVNARFESGADGTALTGQMNLVANTGFVLPYNPVGWFETASNTLLNLELSGAISCDGSLVYTEV